MSGTGEVALPPGEAGVTLIEALVVVTLTTLVALIGFPRVQQSLRAASQREAAAAVVARLRDARGLALRSDRPIGFQVAAGGHGYSVTGGTAIDAPPGVVIAVRGNGADHGSISPSNRIVFFGDGSTAGGFVGIGMARRASTVTVLPQTGVVFAGGA